jgi:hypothetical protein
MEAKSIVHIYSSPSYQIFIYTPKQYMLITAKFQTNGNNITRDHHMTIMLMNIRWKHISLFHDCFLNQCVICDSIAKWKFFYMIP